MAAAERRRGRRDNGLDATDWRAIDDIDPRLSEAVLDLLASRGIPAYVQPAVDVDPVTRSATLPDRPRDRLYVDRLQLPAARTSVRQFLHVNGGLGGTAEPDPADLPGERLAGGDRTGISRSPDGHATAAEPANSQTGESPPSDDAGEPQPGSGSRPGGGSASLDDIDAKFADIVANLGDLDPPTDPTSDTTFSREQSPARAAEPEPVAEEPTRRGPIDGRDVTEPSLLDGLDTFGTNLPDRPDEEPPEQFIPPPPPPLPRMSGQTVLGALAVIAGLIMVVGRPSFLPFDRGSTMLLGFATMLGGATALIMRLRSGQEPDDTHPDDGARV